MPRATLPGRLLAALLALALSAAPAMAQGSPAPPSESLSPGGPRLGLSNGWSPEHAPPSALAPNVLTDGVVWEAVGGGTNAAVHALAFGPDGSLYVGGLFAQAGGQPASRVARWDGAAWHALGGGVNNGVNELALGPGGALYVGGSLTTAGGVPAPYLARATGGALTSTEDAPAPDRPALSAPYPNPARGAATVAFALAEGGPVRLVVYDVLGRATAVAFVGVLGPGRHEASVPVGALAPGAYLVRLEAGASSAARRLTVIR